MLNYNTLKTRLMAMLLVVILCPAKGKAMNLIFQGDARSQGMANNRVMLANQWSGLNNPAGLAGINTSCFGLYYENYFGIPELGMGAFSCGIPARTGAYGISFMSFGYSLFRQSQASLSYGKAFGKNLRAGIGLHYLVIGQPVDYGNLFALVPSLGIQMLPVSGLTLGIYVFNPAGQQYVPSGYLNIPAIFRTGVGYTLGREVLLCAEIEKISKEKAKYYGGVEITLQKVVFIRFGVTSGRFPGFSFGIGYRNRHMSIDMAITRHPVLGFSPALGLSYAIK
jgi:hypothetical protein